MCNISHCDYDETNPRLVSQFQNIFTHENFELTKTLKLSDTSF